VSFLGVQYETYDSPASGGKEVRWLGKPDPKPWSLPLYTSEPALDLTPAKAYWISSAKRRRDRAPAHPRRDDGDPGRAQDRCRST
jgi:hypothetical protein